MVRPIPPQCIALIRSEEGEVLHTYRDTAGNLTIGVGHKVLPGESFPGNISQGECDDLLATDLLGAASAVCRYTIPSINDNQYSALISFTFNEGAEAYRNSHLLKMINVNRMDLVPAQFDVWNKVRNPHTGQLEVSQALVDRRTREKALFLKEV